MDWLTFSDFCSRPLGADKWGGHIASHTFVMVDRSERFGVRERWTSRSTALGPQMKSSPSSRPTPMCSRPRSFTPNPTNGLAPSGSGGIPRLPRMCEGDNRPRMLALLGQGCRHLCREVCSSTLMFWVKPYSEFALERAV